MEFEAKTVLVTGAARGIGKGIAAAFSSAGLGVFVTDLLPEVTEALASELPVAGARAADVTDASQVEAVVSEATDRLGGRINVLVNVAGIVAEGKVEEISEEEWDRVFAVNCKGSFLYLRGVVPIMKARGFGRIINFSSKSGKTGSALMSHYSAAKAAIIGLTQSLAYELSGDGINVNCVCPGITENTGVWSRVSSGYIDKLGLPHEEVVKKFTEKVPLQRLARIEDIVSVVLFLASRGADYMTGQAINITGGREMH